MDAELIECTREGKLHVIHLLWSQSLKRAEGYGRVIVQYCVEMYDLRVKFKNEWRDSGEIASMLVRCDMGIRLNETVQRILNNWRIHVEMRPKSVVH